LRVNDIPVGEAIRPAIAPFGANLMIRLKDPSKRVA
jgi:hypothetical protein